MLSGFYPKIEVHLPAERGAKKGKREEEREGRRYIES